MQPPIFTGDSGTILAVTLKAAGILADVSTATALAVVFQKPDKTFVNTVMTFATDGVDGIVQFVIPPGFLDQAGSWKFQIKVTLPDWNGYTTVSKFKVKAHL